MESSPHFSREELACRCCGELPEDGISVALIDALEWLRSEVGPIHVNCAYRCPKHNREVGGVENSQHSANPCTAADIWSDNVSTRELAELAKLKCDSVGTYFDDCFVHIDQRADGSLPSYWIWSDQDEDDDE